MDFSILLILFFALFLLIRIPVAMVLGMVPVFYMSLKGSVSFIMVPHMMHTGIDVFVLMAIPFFILAGNLMNYGGITNRLLKLADSIVGHIRGGLAHVNIIVSIIFGGMTGAATSDTAAIGSLLIPSMVKAGYSPAFSAAVTAASSTCAPIIPPSIAMVIYSLVTGVSIKKLFIAGFVPGILLGIVFIIVSYCLSLKANYPKNTSFSFEYLIKALKMQIQ
jgi:tripartite ATP-independent transporter DctM subunit